MTRDCANTLILRRRRHRLTDEEQLALGAHLATCESCRLLQTFFDDMERVGQANPGDARRIAAMTGLARDWAKNYSGALPNVQRSLRAFVERFRAWPRWALAATGIVLLTGLASAAGWYAHSAAGHGQRAAAPASKRALPPSRKDTKENQPAAKTPPVAADESAQPPALTTPAAAPQPSKPKRAGNPVALRRSSAGAAPGRSEATSSASAEETAASLFQKANALRRSNHAAGAIAGYQKLQALFPGSPEAQLSDLSLGRLLLATGNAQAALSHFDRALGARAASSVRVEALYGRGLSLSTLGRLSEERQVWERLLREFPSCPYVVHAKRRLAH